MLILAQGIAEGGTIGPFTFPARMDTWRETLASEGCGFGIGVHVPQAWARRQ